MPCTKGMTGCASSCAHRRLVEEYRVARHSEESQREAVTLGYATEIRLFTADHGPLLSFKTWLKGLAHRQLETTTERAA